MMTIEQAYQQDSGKPNPRAWSTSDKLLAGAMLGGITADAWTTINALNRGGNELNPFLGRRPGTAGVILGSLLGAGGTLAIADMLPKTPRKILLGGVTLAGVLNALNNARQGRGASVSYNLRF